jgi:NAD(P)-dependent dehydrogenase (short-subunit alcohol dehydrogenase family)
MHGELDGRVALITGAAQGIGRCVAEFLAADGATVMLADIQGNKVGEVAAGLVAAGHIADAVQADVSSVARPRWWSAPSPGSAAWTSS